MDISIFGLGYVGSVSASCLANLGHTVIGVDNNQLKVDTLNAGKALIIEKDLSALTQKNVTQKKLSATSDVNAAIHNSELSFVCVGTPSKENNQIDLQYVKRVSQQIGTALKDKNHFHTIAYRSTMFPGSMRQVVIPIIEAYSEKKAGKDFDVCVNPEFMMEGTAVNDFYFPPKNVIGTLAENQCQTLQKLTSSYTNMPVITLDLESAEFIKYCDNVWHALKVCYANEIGNVCKQLNIDSHKVMDVFCQDTKLNLSPYYLKPGFAFGGSCLPKDLRAFIYESQTRNVQIPIINSVLHSNKLQIENGLNLILQQKHKNVGFLGFSFKHNTDDLRESPMVELIERLIGKGYQLALYDKNVTQAKLHGTNKEYLLKHVPHISDLMVTSIQEVLAKSSTIVVGTKSDEFLNVIDLLSPEQTLIDLVRLSNQMPQHKNYLGICW